MTIQYLELPPYTNLHILSKEQKRYWDSYINGLKVKMINPIIEKGKPEFDSKYYYDFGKVKEWINDDFVSLVKFFLLCIKELKMKENKEPRILVSLLIGQQEYDEDDSLAELTEDGYGHLKKLQEIYQEYKNGDDKFYLAMMETLCNPYRDVMRSIVYMCKNLFNQEEGIGFDFLKGQEEDYGLD